VNPDERESRRRALEEADKILDPGTPYTYADLIAILDVSEHDSLTDILREAGVLKNPEYATLDEDRGIISLFLSITEGNNLLVEAVIKQLTPEHFIVAEPAAIAADFEDEKLYETREASLQAYGRG